MRLHGLSLLFLFVLAVLLAPVVEAQLSDRLCRLGRRAPRGFFLTKKEKKQWSKITTDAEAEEFIELFWARRNPNINNPFNSFKAEFDAKVRFADENFGYGKRRGALCDRGKVLILMGKPDSRQVGAPSDIDGQNGPDRQYSGTDRGVVLQPRDLARGLQAQGRPPPIHVLRGAKGLQYFHPLAIEHGVIQGIGCARGRAGGLPAPPRPQRGSQAGFFRPSETRIGCPPGVVG